MRPTLQPALRHRRTMISWRIGWLALALMSHTDHATSEIVEASTVTNVVVSSSLTWDLSGCGEGGCDPRLTRDGEDNTVPNSRWSCTPSLAYPVTIGYADTCEIDFEFDDFLMVDHIMLYLHESDTQEISIPFTVEYDIDGLTTPGLALGVGDRFNVNEESFRVSLTFDLTNGQYINLSEVEIYVDVDNPEEMVPASVTELSVVDARTVTNVVATAEYWELSADAGCGEEGCTPSLATDGQDNTVAASRWSCPVELAYEPLASLFSGARECTLALTMDDSHTISHIVVYVYESDDATKSGVPFIVTDLSGYYSDFEVQLQTTPGTELGVGERFNLPRPYTDGIQLVLANSTAGKEIEISEVEIYVEVTQTSVSIAAAPAWTEVSAESLTEVTAYASESLTGFAPTAATDGEDNTVAASRWACDGTLGEGYCELRFEFNDAYTVSHLDLYMHESANPTKGAVSLRVCECSSGDYCYCDSDDYMVGSYVTKPGTPLGEPERINLLYPETTAIGILADNLTAIGGTISISEVEIFLRIPDGTPTPAPFASPAPTTAPTYSWEKEDDDFWDDDDSALVGYVDDADDGGAFVGPTDDDTPAALDPDEDSSGLPGLGGLAGGNGAGSRFSARGGVFFAAAVAAVLVVVSGNCLLCC